MATEQSPTVATDSAALPKWTSWIAPLVGLWVIVSPFVLEGSLASGLPMWSTLVGGLAILVLAGAAAYTRRTSSETETGTPGEYSGWIAALAGLWLAASPFVVTGSIGASTAMWSTIVGGALALILAAYAGYTSHQSNA